MRRVWRMPKENDCFDLLIHEAGNCWKMGRGSQSTTWQKAMRVLASGSTRDSPGDC